jgi:phospholipase C
MRVRSTISSRGGLFVELLLMAGLAILPAATAPALSPGDIGHAIAFMMENRSYDHSLSWVSGSKGYDPMTPITCYTQPGQQGTVHQPKPLGASAAVPDYQGCNDSDPNHDFASLGRS